MIKKINKLRVIFMGTPDFAVPTLAALHNSDDYEVVGVVTQPDKPRGRGQRFVPSPVKAWATANNVAVYQPVKIRDSAMVDKLRELKPDVIVVVAFGQILSEEILNLPPLGCINVHGSLLPKYRGAAPMQASLMNGDEVTGITTMMMAKGLDTGDMLLKREYRVSSDTTLGELHDALMYIGAELLMETLEKIKQGNIERIPQNDEQSTYAPMITKDMLMIDWQKPAGEIHNMVRGLSPVPCVQADIKGNIYKIARTRVVAENSDMPAGTIVSADIRKGLIIATGKGLLEILELKPAGKKVMSAKDFLNGYSL